MNALGFRYVTNIMWCKDTIGLGQYFRGQHEICLFGVMGHVPYKNSDNPKRSCCTESSVIHAKKREHSQKPDGMYAKIENTSWPPYLEVFARVHRHGWDVMGNEAPEPEQAMVRPSYIDDYSLVSAGK